MTATATQISNALVKLFGHPPFWSTKCYGGTFIGGAQDRPIFWKNDTIQYASVDYPVYGANRAYGFLTEAKLQATASDVGDSGSLMTGKVQVREAWHRERTGERGWVGAAVEVDLGDTPSTLTVSSNSWAYFDRNITHRVFYVNFVDSLGTFYEAAKIDYTSEQADNTDSVVINVTPEEIVFNRPLEDKKQTSMFPAVKTAVFWKGRIWGGGLEPRDFADGTELTIYKDTNLVEITNDGDPPDVFIPADLYKGIVDTTTNTVIAYIKRIVNHTLVEVSFPGNPDEDATWPHDTMASTNVRLSGDFGSIYATPIYAGGPGGAIIQGIMSWCPLDTLKDENFYASGAELVRLTTAGDELCVIYDRGIGFYSGEVSAGSPPTCRAFIAAKEIGSFNPTNAWQSKDGTVWFEGGGRLYVIRNGQVVEASKGMGIAGFWERFVEPYGDGLRRYQASYNPQRNMALLVNLPKEGEDSSEFGTWTVAVCHDSMSVHPLRWPDWAKFTAAHCLQHDNGDWQFYTGSSDGHLYKALVRGRKNDLDSDGEATPVDWFYTTGVLWVNGVVYTVGVRFLIESDAADGIAVEVAVDVKSGNINSGTFTADNTRSVTHADLNRLEYVPLNRLSGYAVQYKVSGSTERDFKLISMAVLEDVQPWRAIS